MRYVYHVAALFLVLSTLTTLGALDAEAQTGSCEPALAETLLEANNVRARIFNNGGLFWRDSPHVYEVPRGSEVSSMFNASLWVGGYVDGELRVAGTRYGPYEFWPGPLDASGKPPSDCAPYDRIYKITAADLAAFKEDGFVSPRLREWPWHLGAPVVDGDGNPDNYNLEGGDRPELVGASTLWWVMNDRGNVHQSTDSEPIGLEVHGAAFAGLDEGDLGNTTFYRYKLIYKGKEPLRDAYVGLFSHVEKGNTFDNYIGSDTLRGIAYVYNSDNDDEGDFGYGLAPPALGLAFVQGPLTNADGLDNDGDGTTDEPDERLQMTNFTFHNNGGCVTCDPHDAEEYYYYMTSRWRDQQPFTFGGNAYNFSNTPTNFVFTGDPAKQEYWTQYDINGQGDASTVVIRRVVMSAGPFNMEPGEEQEIGIAIVWARGTDHLDSVVQLRESPVFENPLPKTSFGASSEGPRITAIVGLDAPGDGAIRQPTNTTLHWQSVPEASGYHLQWATNPIFEQYDQGDLLAVQQVTSLELRERSYLGDFAPNQRYYWRVLPFNAAGPGTKWSPVYTFVTSDVEQNLEGGGFIEFAAVANANGPLNPVAGAAADWVEFPGTGRPLGNQQLGEGRWLIHTGDNGSRGSYEAFVKRTILARSGWDIVGPFDYEWRFTERCVAAYQAQMARPGCLGWNGFTSLNVVPVPFELWRVGVKTPDDPSDDVRLIPYVIDWENDGWGLQDFDHSVSPDNDDPESDWVYWRLPADLTPGENGYAAWEAAALALPMGASGFPEAASQDDFFGVETPSEIMGRFVLVNWDGGDVSSEVYIQDLPEPGTVFRIETPVPLPPVLSAPIDGALSVAPEAVLWWQGPATDVQVARDASFSEVVYEAMASGASTVVLGLMDGATYHWRAGLFGQWSDTWSFTVAGTPTSTERGAIPTRFELAQNYPNPFNLVTTLRFGLPQAGRATLSVYNLLGQEVAVLADGVYRAGWHTQVWDASSLASGVYLYRLEAGGETSTRRMVLLK